MSIEQLRAALVLIHQNPKLSDFSGAQSPSRVMRAEQALGLRLPPSYAEFLLKLGCGGFDGEDLFGLSKDDFENSCSPDAVWMTKRMRKLAGMPSPYVLVSHTGDGGYYAIDTSEANSSGECPVVEWWPAFTEAVDNPRPAASDFGDFLLTLVQGVLNHEGGW